jgi:hypothetical protein
MNAFADTLEKWQSGERTQEMFNDTLANISFEGKSGQVTLQGTRINGHRSDRNRGYIHIICSDLAHNVHLMARYSTINSDTGSVSFSPVEGTSTCP